MPIHVNLGPKWRVEAQASEVPTVTPILTLAVGCDVADANAKVAAIFSEAGSLRHQQQLASCLMMMSRCRVHCLGLQTVAAGAAATGRQPAGRRARNPALDALNAIDAELDRLGIFACPIAADE